MCIPSYGVNCYLLHVVKTSMKRGEEVVNGPFDGAATILIYGGSEHSSDLGAGLSTVLEGRHSGHAGMSLVISQEQFDQYIRGYDGTDPEHPYRKEIPYIPLPPEADGTQRYEIAVNFSSIGDFTPNTAETKFVSRIDAALAGSIRAGNIASSALLPRQLGKRKKGYVPQQRYVHGHVPGLSHIAHRLILQPMSSVHINLIPEDMRGGRTDQEMFELIGKFQNRLNDLRAKVVEKENDQAAYTEYVQGVNQAIHDFKNELLYGAGNKLYPADQQMTDTEFLGYFEKFANIGTVPHQYRVPITDSSGHAPGFDMNKMLTFMRQAYDDSKHQDYNLFTHNCSHFVREMLCASTNDHKVRKFFAPKHKGLGHVANAFLPTKQHGVTLHVYTPSMLAKAIVKINGYYEHPHMQQLTHKGSHLCSFNKKTKVHNSSSSLSREEHHNPGHSQKKRQRGRFF